jgi:CBS domain-containing protein
VVDRQTKLVGIVSLSDLVRRAEYRTGADVPAAELLDTLRSISMPAQVHEPAHA